VKSTPPHARGGLRIPALREFTTGHNLGFRFVFGGAALWFVLGTVMVHRIRGVR
jgi:hypothetical protein